jgi:probable HAF family extracellular repeat protein
VGYSTNGAPLDHHAFLWERGTMTDLGSLGGGNSDAEAINASGQIVGLSLTVSGQLHGFVWERGVMTDLGTLGSDFSEAKGINSAGQVVGFSSPTSEQVHAFLWQHGTMTDLGTLLGAGASFGINSSALGINAAGQVAGVSTAAGGGSTEHAVLWTLK